VGLAAEKNGRVSAFKIRRRLRSLLDWEACLELLKRAPVDHCDPYHPFQRRPSEQFCKLVEALNTVNGQQNCAIVSA
jgi:hypothetical protein